jgi:hypothetical protein
VDITDDSEDASYDGSKDTSYDASEDGSEDGSKDVSDDESLHRSRLGSNSTYSRFGREESGASSMHSGRHVILGLSTTLKMIMLTRLQNDSGTSPWKLLLANLRYCMFVSAPSSVGSVPVSLLLSSPRFLN